MVNRLRVRRTSLSPFSYCTVLPVDCPITFADAESMENRDNAPLDSHRVEVEAKSTLEIVTCAASSREAKDCCYKSNSPRQRLTLFLVLPNSQRYY